MHLRQCVATVGAARMTQPKRHFIAALAAVAIAAGAALLLPAAAGAAGPVVTTLEGTLTVEHADNFAAGTSTQTVVLNVPNRAPLQLDIDPSTAPGGQRVRVRGVVNGEKLEQATIIATAAPAPTATPQAALRERRVAVVMFNFADARQTPWTKQQVATHLSQIDAFYESSSDKHTGFAGTAADVYGYYTVPFNRASCDYVAWANAAQVAAEAANPGLRLPRRGAGAVPGDDYDHVVYLFPWVDACSSWGGRGEMPGAVSWLNGGGGPANFLYLETAVHELGHNLGAGHASSEQCKLGTASVSLSDSCSTTEYGDAYSVMGVASYLHHATHSNLFGWPSASVRSITTNGTYKIKKLHGPGSDPSVLRILRGKTGDFFDIESRTWFPPYDRLPPNAAFSVMIRLATPLPNGQARETTLLDANPNTATAADAPFSVGQIFVDRATGISITVNAVDASGATIAVVFPAAPDTTPPGLPGNVRVRQLDASTAEVTWAGATDNLGVAYYSIRQGNLPPYKTRGRSIVMPWHAGSKYTVTAVDGAGNVGPAAPDPPPSAVPNVRATQVTPGQIVLAWNPATDNLGVRSYEVDLNNTGVGTSASTTFTHKNLWPDRMYAYRVRARDAFGQYGPWSAPIIVITKTDTTKPSVPGRPVLSNVLARSARLTWPASTDDTGVQHYIVRRNGVQIATPTSATYVDNRLAPNTSYTWTVIAVDRGFNMGPAVTITGRTPAGP